MKTTLLISALLLPLGMSSLCQAADLLSYEDWSHRVSSPLADDGDVREQDYKAFRKKGARSNDKDLSAWLTTRLSDIVGKSATFEISGCDKTPRHAMYEQEALHGRILQNVLGEIDAWARNPLVRASVQKNFKGVRFSCTNADFCDKDSPLESRLKSDCSTVLFHDGYEIVRYQVGADGEALPYPSGAGLVSLSNDESDGPSLQTQLATALFKKYLPRYSAQIQEAFGAPIALDIDWSPFNRPSKGLPGYPLDGGWITDYLRDGLEGLVAQLPSFIKAYNEKAEQYYQADMPVARRNLKKIRITMMPVGKDAPAQVDYANGVISIIGRWEPSLGVNDTQLVPAILAAAGHRE